MGKPPMSATILFTAVLAVTLFISLAKPQPPMPTMPMTIDGYALIRRIDGTNRTVPAGFAVYAKEGTTIINVDDPESKWITDTNGYYRLGASASSDGVPIDLWIENINVTRIIFRQGTFLTLNLTVIDTVSPVIQILSPQPNEQIPPNKPLWINATVTDNFALAPETVTLTLNGTMLTPSYNPQTGLFSYKTSPLTSGFYRISLSIQDLAGNSAATTWNFNVIREVPPSPPTVTIVSPTTVNPLYIQSPKTVQVTYRYTESSPKNATIKIYNATHIVATATVTTLTGGTDVQRTDNIIVPAGTVDGNYNLNVTIFNIHDLSATATQLAAVKVDNTKPVVTITYPAGGSYISARKIWVNGTVLEANIGANIPTISDTRFTLQKWESSTGKFSFLNNTALSDSQITVTVSFTDLAQNTAQATVTFTLDTTKPLISNPYQNPPGRVIQPGEIVEVEAGYDITVKVNVNELNLEKVFLYYNISAAGWTEIQMTPTTGNEYMATIPSRNYPPCTTIQYYIKAVDKAGNIAQTPTTGIYFTLHIIPEYQKTVLALLPAIALITALAQKRKRKSS